MGKKGGELPRPWLRAYVRFIAAINERGTFRTCVSTPASSRARVRGGPCKSPPVASRHKPRIYDRNTDVPTYANFPRELNWHRGRTRAKRTDSERDTTVFYRRRRENYSNARWRCFDRPRGTKTYRRSSWARFKVRAVRVGESKDALVVEDWKFKRALRTFFNNNNNCNWICHNSLRQFVEHWSYTKTQETRNIFVDFWLGVSLRRHWLIHISHKTRSTIQKKIKRTMV